MSEVEVARLTELASYGVLDTPAEGAFDDLTELAAQVCGTPMALVSLVDDQRQWFKSRQGVRKLEETPRGDSFCVHTWDCAEVFEVTDTSRDPRFRSNPLVTGEPYVRFYAGTALRSPAGHALGALCVLDVKPRQLDASQRRGLQVLARQVVDQMELRRQAQRMAVEVATRVASEAALTQHHRILGAVLQHTDVLIYAKDLQGRFVMTSTAMEDVTSVPGGLLGRTDHDLFDHATADEYRRNDGRIVEARERKVFAEDLVHPDGSTHTYRSTKFPLLDEDGRVLGVAGVSTDVTELMHARAELERHAHTDPLTGLLNRRGWASHLDTLLSTHDPSLLTLMVAVIDLDRFKAYNDRLGHDAGDGLLVEFATAMTEVLADGAVVARWGGEEFAVALPNTAIDAAHLLLGRIAVCVPDRQTCSIGYTSWRTPERLVTAMARADAALYEAKERGRDQIVHRADPGTARHPPTGIAASTLDYRPPDEDRSQYVRPVTGSVTRTTARTEAGARPA